MGNSYMDTKDMNGVIASFMGITLWLLTFFLFLQNDK